MSTKNPIPPATVACSTNWYTRVACKLQAIVEPLCEKRTHFTLTPPEQQKILDSANSVGGGLYSFVLSAMAAHGTTSTAVHKAVETWQQARHATVVWPLNVECILAPRLTITNRVGLMSWKLFSVGTDCSCCWGLRIMLVSAVSAAMGHALHKFL